jgi:hypothetical protein
MGSKIFIPDQKIGNFEIFGGQGSLTEIIPLKWIISNGYFPNSAPITDFLEATYIKKY